MRMKVRINEEHDFILHNETQDDGSSWVAFGFETENIGIEIQLETLQYLVEQGTINNFVNWIDANGETYLRAETQRRSEREAIEEEKRYEQRKLEKQKPKIKTGNPGFIYILKADNGLYKIGKAKHVDSRVTYLGVKIPMHIELLHSFESSDYTCAELHLHEKFKDKRDVGEWFKLDEDDISSLLSIKDGTL